MSDAKQRDNWSHTTSLMALIANTVRNTKKKPKPYKPSDFSPYYSKGSDASLESTPDTMCDVFVERPINPGNDSRKEKWRKRRIKECSPKQENRS